MSADPIQVLLVDEDAVDRLAVIRSLREARIAATVEEREGCASALAAMRARPFDLVVLDCFLPDGDAPSLLRDARAAGVRAPFVVLTGQGDEETAVEVMKAGATDYLPKSAATPERIAQSIRGAMRIHRAERAAALAERERRRLDLLEKEARGEAEEARRRLAFLAEASTIAASSLDYATTLENVARLAVPALADWCFVDLRSDEGGFERVAVAHHDPTAAPLAARFRRRFAPVGDAPHGISRVMTTGESEITTDTPDWILVSVARDAEHLEALRALGIRSTMCVPLVARGRTIGAMTFISADAARQYRLVDLALAEEVARRAAVAVDNARLYAEAVAVEERLRFQARVLDAVGQAVVGTDLQGRVTYMNRAAERAYGWRAEEAMGLDLVDVTIAPAQLAAGAALMARLRDGKPWSGELLASRRDGTTFWASVSATPFLDETGRHVGIIAVSEDVTERRAAIEELEASRRQMALNEKLSALGTLVSGVAHEIPTPLTYLANNLFLTQARLESAARENPRLLPVVEDCQRFASAAMDGVDRINALVKDLRAFVVPEGGRRAPARVDDVVAGAVELFAATQRGQVQLEVDLQPTPKALLDKGQVQRVVINLLVNAAEAIRPGGGRIRVATRTTPEGEAL
ncbi:MAG TPA: PAS domain S-box protein, partial [Candidatus Thermoplasmatota archaeon]|nr:PAS domain S-box protein [Candidatus Thermoplasmatota archaeon]